MGEKRPARGRAPAVGPLLARAFWLAALAWGSWELYQRHQRGAWPWTLVGTGRLEGVVVIPRAQWQAAAAKGSPSSLGKAGRVTVHHSGGRAITAVDRAATGRAIKAIQDEHIRRRGWDDIGYHYIVDRAGRIWEGRPASRVGAHAGSSAANRGNLGVLLLGNFELQQPAPAQLASADRLLDALRRRHGLPRSEVLSHDDVRRDCGLGPTSCPGKNLAPWVDEYRRGVASQGGGRGDVGCRMVAAEADADSRPRDRFGES